MMHWNIRSRSESVTPNIIKVPTIRNNHKKHNIVFCVQVTSPQKRLHNSHNFGRNFQPFPTDSRGLQGEGSRRWRSSFEHLCGRAGRCRRSVSTRSVWGLGGNFSKGWGTKTPLFFSPPPKVKNKFKLFVCLGRFFKATFCLVVPLEFLLSICHAIEHLWLKYPEMTQFMVILEASVRTRWTDFLMDNLEKLKWLGIFPEPIYMYMYYYTST